MQPTPSSVPQRRLARQARQRFVEGICAGLPDLDKTVLDLLTTLMTQTGTAREMQSHRDAWMRYQQHHAAWTDRTGKAWRDALAPHSSTTRGALAANGANPQFELLSDDVVENKILASRMALTVSEQVSQQFDTLRQRTQSLEGQELDSSDILRPEAVCLLLVEQWVEAGLPRTDLQTVVDPLQRELANLLQKQYQAVNVFYVEQGVTPQADLKSRVRRTAGGAITGSGGSNDSGAGGLASQALAQTRDAMAAARGGMMPPQGGRPMPQHPSRMPPPGYPQHGMPTAFATGMTPLARARQRAHGVMGQLRRLLTQPATGFDMVNAPPASAALAHALTAHRVHADTYYSGVATLMEDYSPAAVVQLAGAVRERSTELKKKASTAGEKAIIEVVALMFQSILAEDRIPPAVRVWFARLQVPVLRVALAEPEFFSNLNHPARQLIDRMGACVMGFDATSINGSALEAEIRRVVQVIEQYPETGRRVFQLVYDEFEKFLSKFLTEKQATSRLVTVAQQVEQRETLAIQYTIELRTMLRDMPVRDEIREFLFKTWAEVLALSAVRDGPQHADTISLKRTAADLVWAASAKPNRSDRAQVIQNLPGLLQRLRQGLALMGVNGAPQDAQIKILTDTLADAFLSKTASIPQAHIDAMAKRLANLEDFISDATLGDMPLNADNIEMMLGIDASSIHVVADNGAPVEDAMVAWAQELQPGTWYTLDHNGASAQVQYAWQSQRKQLHLFAAVDGSSYLIQLRRLAAYLQAGLLVAQDEEGLTLRATRDALAKLDANPERLLD
ncbi:MAG: DUF1631 domain-containing protein [Acidovorax sp.]|jgi:hypothetical protein|uniref:DUF1631 domain-containing protein n=1 Tax=Acidovorax TaxID=12916 RepID=UPI0008BDBB5D|nr:DUF1631 domain-containing protein [Acidovorax sp. 94]MBT9443239.1 DUF1631 domain-containing protein [Acidovorax sp.]OGA87381.1 MAG: hypothetical protein A2Z90_10495 [Burkholderiales bacterium GWA2_64_37]RKR69010.1 uncharacterized protein DUF1631 [Acidovorax sp. 94]HCE94235.1 DUF1631 domain-containing protein [Acidovorax sp.]